MMMKKSDAFLVFKLDNRIKINFFLKQSVKCLNLRSLTIKNNIIQQNHL